MRPRSEAARHAGQVVVGVDGAPASDRAIGFAFEEAGPQKCGARRRARVASRPHLAGPGHRVHATDDADGLSSGASSLIDAAISPWRTKYSDVKVTTFRMHGHPVTVLGYAAAGSPLLVVGTRRRGDLKAVLLGSVSRGILHHDTGPVAVIPASA